VLVDGERRWVTYAELETDDGDFVRIGDAFAASGDERSGPVGAGVGRLMSQRALVAFGGTWLQANRPGWAPTSG